LALGNEGLPERRIAVVVGVDTIEATIDNNRVWRIEVETPRLRTADSLGVGTTASALNQRGATLAVGEGVFAILPTHCGLSFQLNNVNVAQGRSWRTIPDSARVSRVLVFGCPPRG
jgi:hypothetical protein